MGRFIRIFLLAFFILTVSTTPLLADPGNDNGWGNGEGGGQGHGVPEIDPGRAPSALALLSGGMLILKSKSGKKK